MNLLDYIAWRGDLSFEERKLNEIDSLILSILAYENYDGILSEKENKTLKETADCFFEKYDEETLKNRVLLTNRSYELLKEAANTKRFGELVMSNYINEVDEQKEVQFAAVTFCHKEWKYVAFRGTDDTIVGWKEDFAMTYRDEVPSQHRAVEYIHRLDSDTSFLNKLLKRDILYIGGHSKGGNLAMYAAAAAAEEIQKKMKRVDNFDGPGFHEEMWQQPSFQRILPLIHTYIPNGSVFGRLFAHLEKVSIIKSDQSGLLQHDAFSWHVTAHHFVYQEDMTLGSEKAAAKLNSMLDEYTPRQREELVASLFNVFEKLNIHTLSDLTKLDLSKGILAIREINALDSRSKKVLVDMLKVIWDVSEILPFK
ncbi:Mbeg1-like protein [Traorella massiliensis]|uniref:Mbeg1-like protein n=1 Tax=Traorella massiliensis TaxID=1903263 RepID=UPI0008F8B36B|nr:Mbeg1-like protein [Traorella massiliensis]